MIQSLATGVHLVNGWGLSVLPVSILAYTSHIGRPTERNLLPAPPCKIEEIPEIDAVIISVRLNMLCVEVPSAKISFASSAQSL